MSDNWLKSEIVKTKFSSGTDSFCSQSTDELMGISHRNVATILWRIFLGSRFGESCLSFHTISARLCEYVKFTAGLTCPHKVGGQSINDVTVTGPW